MLRQAALAFLPLAGMVPSLIWTTNHDRSQEVLLLFFSYSCLLFSLWRCKFRSGALCASLSTLVAVAMVVEAQALYQHFVGLDALKAELAQRTNMDADFRAALLARAESGRVFANFSLPNTLAGLVTMILPIQAGLLVASFSPSKLLARQSWLDHDSEKLMVSTCSGCWSDPVRLGAGTDSEFWRVGLSLLLTWCRALRVAFPERAKGRLDHRCMSAANPRRILARMDLIQKRFSFVEPERR